MWIIMGYFVGISLIIRLVIEYGRALQSSKLDFN